VQDGHYWLAIIGVLSSVVSVFFYLRIVVMMYMTEAPGAPARPAISIPAMAALGFAVLATFYLGILPARVLDYALQSIQTIF
jgi:NADH-quinone oxidoreductase subunit N